MKTKEILTRELYCSYAGRMICKLSIKRKVRAMSYCSVGYQKQCDSLICPNCFETYSRESPRHAWKEFNVTSKLTPEERLKYNVRELTDKAYLQLY